MMYQWLFIQSLIALDKVYSFKWQKQNLSEDFLLTSLMVKEHLQHFIISLLI